MLRIIHLHDKYDDLYDMYTGIDLIYDMDHNELYFELYKGDLYSTFYYISKDNDKNVVSKIKDLINIYNHINDKILLDPFSGEGFIRFDFRLNKVYISRYSNNSGDIYFGQYTSQEKDRIINDLTELTKEIQSLISKRKEVN